MNTSKTSGILGIDKQLKNKLIALDSMVFIYLIEQTDPYFPICKKILHFGESGQTKIISSIISVLESLSPPKYIFHPEVQREITNFFENTTGLSIFPVDKQVCLEASRLRRENPGLKTPDSIQLATAIVHQANIFISNDGRLAKLDLPIKIIPLDTIHLDSSGKAIK